MLRVLVYFSICLTLLSSGGCALNRGLKVAQEIENSGLHDLAYGRYLELWIAHQAWQAKAGMDKNAEVILTKKFNPLQSSCDRTESFQQAQIEYDEFLTFSAKFANHHPDLVKSFQGNVVPFRNQCRKYWLERYTGQMRQYSKEAQWAKANEIAEQLLRMDANNEEAKLMQRLAQVEMAVALAEQAMEEGFYKQAHQYASAALLWDKNEARAEKIRKECLEKCSFSVRVVLMSEPRTKDKLVQKLHEFGMHFRLLGRDQYSDMKFLTAYLQSYLTQGEFPFLQILDDNHFESISKEQLNALNLQYSQENADVVLGELKTASTLLVIEPLVWEMKTAEQERIPHWVMQRRGKEDKVIKVYLEPESVYLSAQLRLSLINTTTGTTVASEIMDLSGQKMFYKMDGDISAAQLFPTEQGGDNSVYLSREELVAIQERQSKNDRYTDVLDMAIEKWRGLVLAFIGDKERSDIKRN